MWVKCLKLEIALRLKRILTDLVVFLGYLRIWLSFGDTDKTCTPSSSLSRKPQPSTTRNYTPDNAGLKPKNDSFLTMGRVSWPTIPTISYNLPLKLFRFVGTTQVYVVSLRKINITTQGPWFLGQGEGASRNTPPGRLGSGISHQLGEFLVLKVYLFGGW